jgi:hypothetical protein
MHQFTLLWVCTSSANRISAYTRFVRFLKISRGMERKSWITRRNFSYLNLRNDNYFWKFFSSPPRPNRLWGPPSLLSNGYQGLLPREQSGRGVKLTNHLHLVPRSRMHGAIPPFPNTPSWCGAQLKHRDNFTFYLYLYLNKKQRKSTCSTSSN